MKKVAVDLERDLFRVTAEAERPTEEELLAAIRKLGYGPTVVDAPNDEAATPRQVATYRPSELPKLARDALTKAGEEDKLLLIDFYADWCPPCRRMFSETWSDARVKEQLRAFVFLKVDTDVHPEVKKHFRVSGIPDARILAPDGTQVGRIFNFQTSDQVLPILRNALTRARASTK